MSLFWTTFGHDAGDWPGTVGDLWPGKRRTAEYDDAAHREPDSGRNCIRIKMRLLWKRHLPDYSFAGVLGRLLCFVLGWCSCCCECTMAMPECDASCTGTVTILRGPFQDRRFPRNTIAAIPLIRRQIAMVFKCPTGPVVQATFTTW